MRRTSGRRSSVSSKPPSSRGPTSCCPSARSLRRWFPGVVAPIGAPCPGSGIGGAGAGARPIRGGRFQEPPERGVGMVPTAVDDERDDLALQGPEEELVGAAHLGRPGLVQKAGDRRLHPELLGAGAGAFSAAATSRRAVSTTFREAFRPEKTFTTRGRLTPATAAIRSCVIP